MYDLELTASALQIDSFCPDSAHPVILQSQAPAASDTPHAQGHAAANFALSVQVGLGVL